MKLLLDPTETRFQMGIVIAILKWHIPPNIKHQESEPVLPLRFRTHEVTDPIVRKWVETYSMEIYHLQVFVWKI